MHFNVPQTLSSISIVRTRPEEEIPAPSQPTLEQFQQPFLQAFPDQTVFVFYFVSDIMDLYLAGIDQSQPIRQTTWLKVKAKHVHGIFFVIECNQLPTFLQRLC